MTEDHEEDSAPAVDAQTIRRNMYAAYTGKTDGATLAKDALLAGVRNSAQYKAAFALRKDDGMALDDLILMQKTGVVAQAWLLNANYEKTFKGKSSGKGGLFRLIDGSNAFVPYGGPVPGLPPVLSEFVFKNVSVTTDLSADPPASTFVVAGIRPDQEKHGMEPPSSSLSAAIEKCQRYNKKKGIVIGESFNQELAILTITDTEEDIKQFPPGDFSDKPTLSYMAIDHDGKTVRVEADPVEAAAQLGIPVEAPIKMWRNKLRGRSIVANGKLSIYVERGDKFFGGEGTLSRISFEHQGRMKPRKDATKFDLNLSDIHDGGEKYPAIKVGDKLIYRLESRVGKDKTTGQDKTYYTAFVRADLEVDNAGRPLPPTINCLVKRGVKNGKDWAMNDGAFISYQGLGKASSLAQSLLDD